MSQLKVTQRRSVIDRPKDQKSTVRRLGLHRINDSVVKDDRPEIRGMIAKVAHLVRVEEVDAMKLHHLKPAEGATRTGKRMGRGRAGGQGKTAGRGTKGWGAARTRRPGSRAARCRCSVACRSSRASRNPNRVECAVVNVERLGDLRRRRRGHAGGAAAPRPRAQGPAGEGAGPRRHRPGAHRPGPCVLRRGQGEDRGRRSESRPS